MAKTRKVRSLRSKRRSTRCRKGYILRKGSTRKSSSGKRVRVTARCIKDRGLPGKGYKGKGPGIGKLREGELSQFGYSGVSKLSESQRHTALKKAIAQYGALDVWRKLNAVAVYTKHTSPVVSRVFKSDMAWIRSSYGGKNGKLHQA
jgi:hypothetical protein